MMKRLFFVLIMLCSFSVAVAQNTSDEQLGIQYYQNGEYEKAIDMFAKVYNKKPNSYIYYYYYQALLETKNYKEAEKLVKKQIREQPNVQRFKVDLGYMYEKSNDLIKAQKEYENIIKEVPAKEPSVMELSNAFLSRGKRDYALQTLIRGRKLLENNKLFYAEITRIYMELRQVDKIVEETMTLIIDDDPNSFHSAKNTLQDLLLDDENGQNYLTVKNMLLRNMQKNPNNTSYPNLLFWIYLLNKDYPAAFVLAKSIDKKEKGSGEIMMSLAEEATAHRDFGTAIEALNYVIAKGENSDYYVTAKFELLNVRYTQLTSISPVKMTDALLLEKEFKKLLEENGYHQSNVDWIRKYAHLLAFYVSKPEEGIVVLNKAIDNTDDVKVKALFKTDMADIMLYSGNVWDATLLYSQVEKALPNDTIGQMAKFKNAKLSFYIGEFKWAKSQLDVLKAATTRLISNDAIYFSLVISDNEEDEEETEEDEDTLLFGNNEYNIPLRYFAKADFLRFQNKDDEALRMLDSVLIVSPFGKLADDVYYQKALIAIRQQKYFEAEEFLNKILTSYSFDILADDATFMLAELYEYYLKDTPRAMEYYQNVMKNYPGSMYVIEARKRFRALRGDGIIN
jgi:hypothetical protein